MVSVEYWSPKSMGVCPEAFIERGAKVAYRSEAKITAESYKEFLPRVVLKNRDHSVAEHSGRVIHAKWMRPKELIRILEVNPLIPYRAQGDDGYKLLLNGRNLLEISTSNYIYGDMLIASYKQHYPTLMADYSSGHNVIETVDAHENTEDPRLILASYFIKGVSRVTETQWVRHRRMSYTVMSGRGVDVRDQEFVWPDTLRGHTGAYDLVESTKQIYQNLRDLKHPRQDARYVLPQGLSTEMLVTASLEWWNYFFKLRCYKPAQWEIRQFARMINEDLHTRYPELVAPVVGE